LKSGVLLRHQVLDITAENTLDKMKTETLLIAFHYR